MEFAVLDDTRRRGAPGEAGVALIAREDYEGLDLAGGREGARLPRRTAPDEAVTARRVKAHKKLPRRVVAARATTELQALGRGAVGARRGRDAGRGAPAGSRPSASCVEDPTTPRARRRRVPLVLLRVEPRRGPTRATRCANVRAPAEGASGQAAQRLLVLHHLREHRRLLRRPRATRTPRDVPWRPSAGARAGASRSSARCSTAGSSPSSRSRRAT